MFSLLRNNLSMLFFNNLNRISYNLFNKIFSIFKCRLNSTNNFINAFYKNGYVKSKTVSTKDILEINLLLKNEKEILKNNVTKYIIQDELKFKIKELFNKYYIDDIKQFEKYFSSKIIITNIMIWKNHGYDLSLNSKDQFFSEKYHTDNYLFTYFKLFINLEDVDENKGPLHLINKNNIKEFFKLSNYKNRHNYNEQKIKSLVFKNIGKVGESLFFNSAECPHRAGVPQIGSSRLMLGFIFNVVPNIEEQNYFLYEKSENDIFENDYWSKYFGKPRRIIDIIKLLKLFLLNNKNKKY